MGAALLSTRSQSGRRPATRRCRSGSASPPSPTARTRTTGTRDSKHSQVAIDPSATWQARTPTCGDASSRCRDLRLARARARSRAASSSRCMLSARVPSINSEARMPIHSNHSLSEQKHRSIHRTPNVSGSRTKPLPLVARFGARALLSDLSAPSTHRRGRGNHMTPLSLRFTESRWCVFVRRSRSLSLLRELSGARPPSGIRASVRSSSLSTSPATSLPAPDAEGRHVSIVEPLRDRGCRAGGAVVNAHPARCPRCLAPVVVPLRADHLRPPVVVSASPATGARAVRPAHHDQQQREDRLTCTPLTLTGSCCSPASRR